MRLYQTVLCLATLQRTFGSATQSSADEAVDTSEATVGWRANPTGRGTLSLLYSCLITIFACTWAVLHLNVPAPDDSTWVKLVRKIKWMGITILLPEFVFAKAVCELRLALKSLAEFYVLIPPCREDSLRTKTSYGEYRHVVQTWRWQLECSRVQLFLCWLMCLPRPNNPPVKDEMVANTHQENRRPREYPDSENENSDADSPDRSVLGSGPEDTNVQENLNNSTEIGDNPAPDSVLVAPPYPTGVSPARRYDGWAEPKRASGVVPRVVSRGRGLELDPLGPRRRRQESSGSQDRVIEYTIFQRWTLAHAYLANMGGLLHMRRTTDRLLDRRAEYAVLTSAKLSRFHPWENVHPLRGLILSEDDIADKSKADWLLKTMAVLQIAWLICTVAARGVLGLPVTQLEIATLAFSIFAIATYAANFWKPKDVSRPVLLVSQPNGHGLAAGYDWTQSFVGRLMAPAATRANAKRIRDVYRVKNDMIWMPPEEGNVPLVFYLMATSALVFGGLHCLAWNFAFPSRAELLLWRITSLASAVIPTISLLISVVLNYLATGHSDKVLAAWLVPRLAPVSQFPQEYLWFLQVPVFFFWPPDAIATILVRPSASRNFNEVPSREEVDCARAEWRQADTMASNRVDLHCFNSGLEQFWRLWKGVQNGSRNPRLEDELCICHLHLTRSFVPEIQQFWDDYEELYARKHCGIPAAELPQIKCVRHIVDALEQLPAEVKKIKRYQETCEKISRFSTIIGGILYVVVRFIILILLFTSLRGVPPGVYETTPWTRFLPNFS